MRKLIKLAVLTSTVFSGSSAFAVATEWQPEYYEPADSPWFAPRGPVKLVPAASIPKPLRPSTKVQMFVGDDSRKLKPTSTPKKKDPVDLPVVKVKPKKPVAVRPVVVRPVAVRKNTPPVKKEPVRPVEKPPIKRRPNPAPHTPPFVPVRLDPPELKNPPVSVNEPGSLALLGLGLLGLGVVRRRKK